MIQTMGRMILRMLSILFSTALGIFHLMILFFFLLVGSLTGLGTLVLPIIGLLRALGVVNIFIIWEGIHVPAMIAIPTGIFLGIICASISWCCFHLTSNYYHFISKYKSLKRWRNSRE
jgi:hypothetical protein